VALGRVGGDNVVAHSHFGKGVDAHVGMGLHDEIGGICCERVKYREK